MKYIFGLIGTFAGGVIALLFYTLTLPSEHSAYGDPALVLRRGIEGDSIPFFIILVGAFAGLLLGLALGSKADKNKTKQSIIHNPSSQAKHDGLKYIKCPSCLTVTADNTNFCAKCGHKLKTICPNCKSPNDVNSRFCISCGSNIQHN